MAATNTRRSQHHPRCGERGGNSPTLLASRVGYILPGGGERLVPFSLAHRGDRLVGAHCGGSWERGTRDIGLDAESSGRDVRDSDEGLRAIIQHVRCVLHYSRTSKRRGVSLRRARIVCNSLVCWGSVAPHYGSVKTKNDFCCFTVLYTIFCVGSMPCAFAPRISLDAVAFW